MYGTIRDKDGLRAVFYARVSTQEEEQLNAIELQIEENRSAIEKKEWILVDEYIDRGKTGTMVKGRDEYQRLCDDLYSSRFDVVVVKDQDRLMRNTLDWYVFIHHLVQSGKLLYFYLDNKFYTPDDALTTGIKAIIAEDFSRNLSKKLRNYHDNRLKKAKQGAEVALQGNGNAFGWDRVDGKYVLNKEQAYIRRRMCEGVMARRGSTAIIKELNDEGYRNTVGKPFRPQDVAKFVYDWKNVGVMILNKERNDFESKKIVKLPESEWIYLKGAYEPIVTEEEWELICKIQKERIQAVGGENRIQGKKVSEYSFSGKISCGMCGSPYWRKQKKNGTEYWGCSRKLSKGSYTRKRKSTVGEVGEINEEGCDADPISTRTLMRILDEVSTHLQANTDIIKADMINWLTYLKSRILEANKGATEADLEKELARKDKLLEGYLDGIVSKADYAKKKVAIEERIAELEKLIDKNRDSLSDLEEIDRVLANIDAEVAEYVNDNKKLRVDYLVSQLEEVVVYHDKVIVKIPILGGGISISKDTVRNSHETVPVTNCKEHYLHDIHYWGRDIGLYIKLVA